jgi:hypothetical protein
LAVSSNRTITPETAMRIVMAALLLVALALFVLYFANAVPGGVMAIGVNVCLGVALVFSFFLKRRERRPKVAVTPSARSSPATPTAARRKRRKR